MPLIEYEPYSGCQEGPKVPLGEVVRFLFANIDHLTIDKDNENLQSYLACPFWKHNPSRYIHVKNSCTSGVGFKDIGKLTEHIRRVHCLWNGCEGCRKRFNKNRIEEVDKEKREHMKNCNKKPKELTKSDAEWMDEHQDAEYRLLNFQKDKGDPKQCYEKICVALWGPDTKNEIEGPYNTPGFQLSVFQQNFLEWVGDVCRAESHSNAMQTGNAAPSPNPQGVVPAPPSMDLLGQLQNEPYPFHRQNNKDSAVDVDSDNQRATTKPTPSDLPNSEETDDMEVEEAEEVDDRRSTQMDIDHLLAYMNRPESQTSSDSEFNRNADGDMSF